MYVPQYSYDLQENHGGVAGSTDSQSWLSGGDHAALSPSVLQRTFSSVSSASASAAGNVDRVLYNDLIEIVPLIHSLIDQKPKTSFTRRGSMIYTKAPSRESIARKTTESKGGQQVQSKKQDKSTDHLDGNSDFSIFSSTSLPMEKDKEELVALREQMEDLQRKLSEKDELLKSAEISKTEMATMQAKLDEMRTLAAEKDLLLKSTQQQLSDVKIDLADKQAAMEKLQWEAMTSNQRVEKLQKDLEVVHGEISLFMLSFEDSARNRPAFVAEDHDSKSDLCDHLCDTDGIHDGEMQLLKEAREAYVAAVAAAKEKRDEESIAAAARARLRLQSLVLST